MGTKEKMRSIQITTAIFATIAASCEAFTTLNIDAQIKATCPLSISNSMATSMATSMTSTSLNMANDNDLLRWARSARSASAEDRVVELKRPLGIVLNEDDSGNVYV